MKPAFTLSPSERAIDWRGGWLGAAYFAVRLTLHEWFWRARMYLAARLLRRRGAVLDDVRRHGVARIPAYFSEAELRTLENDLDDAVKSCADRPNGVVGRQMVIQRDPGMMRIKHIGEISPLAARFGRDWYTIFLNLVFAGRFNVPAMVYAVTHDGSGSGHAPAGKAEHPYADYWHYDHWTHQLKAVCLLTDVSEENGATVVIDASSAIDWHLFSAYHRQYLASVLGRKYRQLLRDEDLQKAEFYDNDHIEKRFREGRAVYCSGQRGDLLLFDSRSMHKAGAMKRGVRKLLWYYF
jgi:hypothetical protein